MECPECGSENIEVLDEDDGILTCLCEDCDYEFEDEEG